MSSLADLAGGALKDQPSFEHAGDPVGELHGLADVLLDQEDGGAGADDGRHGLVDLLHDHGREAQRDLVEKEQPRVGHESPADGQGPAAHPRKG